MILEVVVQVIVIDTVPLLISLLLEVLYFHVMGLSTV